MDLTAKSDDGLNQMIANYEDRAGGTALPLYKQLLEERAPSFAGIAAAQSRSHTGTPEGCRGPSGLHDLWKRRESERRRVDASATADGWRQWSPEPRR